MLFFIRASSLGSGWEMTLKATRNHLEDLAHLKAAGRLVFYGAMIGKKGGIEIVNLDSTEELAAIINPILPFFDIEVVPLIGYDGVLNLLEKYPEFVKVEHA